MNINQHFTNLATKAAKEGANANELITQRDRLFKDKVIPELVKRKANDAAIAQARTKWNKQTDQVMQSAGLLPKNGQSSASFAKDKRAEKAIQESVRTGSNMPIIKETAKTTADTIGNLFVQGVGGMIEGAAGFVRDIGENEKDSISAKVAKYGKDLKKGYQDSASTYQKELQAGKHGKTSQLAAGAVQSIPAMAMPFGVAKGAVSAATKVPMLASKAPYIGMGAGLAAGHTQNYGEVRSNATANLQRDFPTWEKLQGNPLFEQRFQQLLNSGVNINAARQQAHADTLDQISEGYADKYGSMMTALDFIAPSGAVLGSGILKNAPTSKIGKALVGGGVSSALVRREIAQSPRVGMAKLIPDVSVVANKEAAKMVGKQAAEEGLQGGIGEYGAQAASANIGGQAVDWGKIGQTVLEEGAIGGIMGGGMQSATGGSATSQAKEVAKQLRNQTNQLRQEEAAARSELAQAMQFNNPEQIQSAQENLNNIGIAANKVKAAYDQYGIDTPYFVQRFAAQYQPQPEVQQEQDQQVEPQEAVPVDPAAEAQPQVAPVQQEVSKPIQVNQGMANTTNLVMDSVTKGLITPEEANAIQTDPLLGQVFSLAQAGNDSAANNIVINAASLGNITPDQAQVLIAAIPRYKNLSVPIKPSLSGIVDNHVKSQVNTPINPQDGGLFSNPVELDPETLEPIDKNQPSPFQDDFNEPKQFMNPTRAKDYIRVNNLNDSHELIQHNDGMIEVRPRQNNIPEDPTLNDFGFNPARNMKPVAEDPNLTDFSDGEASVTDLIGNDVPEVIDDLPPVLEEKQDQPQQRKKDFSKPKEFSNYIRAYHYVKENHLEDTHEIIKHEDGSATVQLKEQPRQNEDVKPQENNEPDVLQEDKKPEPEQKEEPAPEDNLSFADKIRDAHLNNPNAKPKLINDEVAKGRPRPEVLKEVADVVKAISTTNETKPEPVEDQKINKNGIQESDMPDGMKAGDIGRGSDGKPYLSKNAALRGLKLNNVKDTHEIVEISPSNFVLREKKEAKAESLELSNKRNNFENQYKRSGVDSKNYTYDVISDDSRNLGTAVINDSGIVYKYPNDDQNTISKVDELANNLSKSEKVAQAAKKGADEAKTPAPKKQKNRTLLGKNKYGNEVYEDERGVRSYYDPLGVFITESVSITPNGIEFGGSRGNEYEVVEQKDKSNNEQVSKAYDDLKAIQKEKIDWNNTESVIQHYEKERDALLKMADMIDDKPSEQYYKDEAKKAEDSINEYQKLKSRKNTDNSETVLQSALKAYHDARDKPIPKGIEERAAHYTAIANAAEKLSKIDPSNETSWKDEQKKYADAAAKMNDRLAKRQEQDSTNEAGLTVIQTKYGETLAVSEADLKDSDMTNIQSYSEDGKTRLNKISRDSIVQDTDTKENQKDDSNVQQLDQTSQRTLEATPSENVQRVREQGDSTAETPRSSGTNVQGSGPTRTRGDDTRGSVADGEREVSIPAGRNADNNGLDPQQAVVANNSPVDAFVIDEGDIGKGGKKTKFKANIEAIKIIKQLEVEKRPATKAEQKALSKFVGWGGLAEAFKREDGSIATGWTNEVAELESLLTKDEMKAAVDSSIAAHYTSPEIVKALWQAVDQFGFKNGRVLEPSVGVGNFFGLMPKNMRKASNLYAVELDNITGSVAKHLYPEANVKAPMGFQDYQIIDNYFDIAIGNPPFSSITINDQVKPKISGFSLHNYFFAKSVDSLKPNGILAMVVTNRFLDKMGDKERSYIAERAELVGAIRLPNDAFLSNAGTQVTTDIIFLRKKAEGETNSGESWLDVKNYTDKDGNTVPLNEYFVRHPENMLGDFGAYGSMYKDGEPALIKREGQDTGQLLNDAIERLPKDVFKAEPSQDFEQTRQAVIRDISEVKVGAKFVNSDGEIHERLPDVMGDQKSQVVEFTNDKAKERVIGMINTADKLTKVRTLQLDKNATDKQISAARKELNDVYDQFVKEHGFINSDTNKRLMRDDPNWPQLAALENNYDRGVSASVAKSTGQKFRKPSAEKAAIFSKRTQVPAAMVEHVSNAQDALTESLNRHGYVNTKTMQQLYAGKSESEIISELGDLVYEDPIDGYVVRDDYLSGNVKKKLAIAREHAEKDPKYERNVRALEKVIPADIEALDIDVKLGSHWIPANHMGDFVSFITGSPNGKAEYSRILNKWEVTPSGITATADATYSTSRVDTNTILSHAVNGTKPTVYDRFSDGTSVVNQEATLEAAQRVEQVKDAWKEWIWDSDARRENLERIYNDIFNTTVNREYDGSHLVFHGMNSSIELRPHQKNAVWRSVQSKATLYDHTVGAGKTFTVITAAMEMRRMGIVNKPLIVVPNHLVGQWANDFVLLYPNANILAATKKDFEKANRKKFIAKMANGDYDAIIIAHSSFGKISISPEQEQTFIDNEIAEIMAFEAELRASNNSRTRNAKAVAKRRLALEEKKKNLLNRENKDTDNIYWHELGIDSIMLDEAHEFKNLEFNTSMQNVAGLGTGKGSQKAKDLFAKIQIMQGNNPKSKLIFATGTPISNTMAEMFTMQRYLDWANLKEQGINQFDAWAKVFGEVVSDWELSPSGKYKLTNRFAKFVNMPELMQGYLGFSDVMNRDDINAQLAKEGKTLGTPKIKGNKPQNIVVERSDEQAEFIGIPSVDENGFESYPEGSLVWRTENLPRKPEKGADNMLKIMGDARKAALDMRLVDPDAPDFEGSKVNIAVGKIFETYKKWNAKKGTQLVFCDLSTPKGAVAAEKARIEQLVKLADDGDEAAQAELDKLSPDELSALDSEFSVYDDVKAKLIAKGMKESEIAFIHDAKTELQKQELFEKVKRGDIRVLIGSTAKMGAGMNVQNKLVALHHLDAPWRPSDLEQREGRIIRQGNEFYKADPEGFEIEINRYATKQTLDSRMWQTIESKAKFIEQVRKGAGTTRVVEDIAGEAANAAEMKAASSGDPRILEEMDLRKQIKELEDDKRNFDRGIHRTKGIIRDTQRDIDVFSRRIESLEQDVNIKQPEKFVYTNGNTKVNQEDKGARESVAKTLETGIKNALAKGKEEYLGQLNGFKISASPASYIGSANIFIQGNSDEIKIGRYDIADSSSVGLVQKILNQIKLLPEDLKDFKDALKNAKEQIPALQNKVKDATWNKSEQLAELKSKHMALIDELKPKKKEPDQQQQNSRRSGTGKGSTPDQVRAELVNRFGENTIKQLEQSGVLNIIESHAEQGVEGFAENGRVTLVADAITPDNIVPVFLHELGGHVGFQGVMKPAAYAVLMKEFNRLVKSGNAEALKAKQLAERETDADVQADEYLPYLITVAAQNQSKQGPAQKLISRVLSAVKVWAVDKLGLNLKLNPSDILALAERMIQTVSNNPPPTGPKGRRYSKASTNPADMSRSKQREFLDTAAKTAFGKMALRGAEGSKTLSNRTLKLFQTMLHKALTDKSGEFKKTFDLVQGKINHVTFASTRSMDVAPTVLTQLETGSDYVKEVKRVGRQLGNATPLLRTPKAKVDTDLEKVGKFMLENTLLENSERHTVKELKQLGFDDDQIKIYNEIREAIDTSLDTFANTTFSNIYKHLGGTNEEVLELEDQNLEIHAHYNEVLKRIDALTKGKPEKAEARQAAIEAIDRVFKKANDLKDQGYVPLMRFGKYFVRIYNPTTGEVAFRQHFESESERNLFFRNYDQSKIQVGYEIEQGQINELQYKLFQGVSPETVALFAKESGLPIGDAEKAYIKFALQNNHALKRLLKRQGIDGFDTDIKRILASFVMSNARYSANQTYNPAIDESITNIKDPAYQEDAIRLRDYSLDTQEELAAFKNFAFVYYMGFSAMFGIVNLTQPFMQTLPFLMQYSKDHSITFKAMGKAITTWRKGTDTMDPKYKSYYERARKEGHLDPQNTWMMQGLERGKSGLGAGLWQLISHASGLFAQASETVNRRTTLFAALDVAESLGQAKLEKLGFKDAYDFAIRTIQETQGIYNKGNRPRVARGNIGSILMMYKQFMISYIEQMVRMQKSGLYGGEDDEFKKKMAALVGFGVSRSVLAMLGLLFFFSGATGLPFMRDILDGIETAGGLVGKPLNTEREIQIALHNALGQTIGSAANTVLMDGTFNLNPLVDVKGRMGMGDLIPVTAYFSPTTSEYMKSAELANVAGPMGGLVEKVKEAVLLAQVGSYGQAGIQLLPKAITSTGQGAVAAATGDYRNMKTGVKTNSVEPWEGVLKMMDMQPSSIAKEGRIRGLEMKDKAAQDYVNKRWKERYEEALATGDRAAVREVQQQIKDYNKENERYPIKFNQKRAETNFKKSNQSWQEKRKDVKGLEWMSDYNPYLEQ